MCELLGLAFNEPVTLDVSFRGSRHRGATSCGHLAPENTHPFLQELRGTPVLLFHNRTLRNLPQPTSFTPIGDTDSEQALCVLLSWMHEEEVLFSDFRRIERQLQELSRHGTLNLLFSTGAELYAYRDKQGYNGLCTRPLPHAS